MPKTFLRTRIVQDEAVAAAGAVRSDDMPVNPLSVILVTIRAEVLAAFTLATIANLVSVFSKYELVYKGQNIVSLNGADLYAAFRAISGRPPTQVRKSDAVANARVWITLPILLGRKPYDDKECFPAVRRGELSLQLTPAASFGGITNPTVQIETIELLDATPERFMKYTTLTKTFTAIGDNDVDLPIGNPIIGVLLHSLTVPVDASFNTTIGQLRLLVDNVEYGYALTNWESLKGAEALRMVADWQASEGSVRTGGVAPAANELLEPYQWPTAQDRAHAYLDFDPTGDMEYALMTEGRSRVHLRINADVADTVRITPFEMIAVAAR